MLMPRGSSRTRSIRTNASSSNARVLSTRLRLFPKAAFRSGSSGSRSHSLYFSFTFSRVSCTSSLRSWTTGISRYLNRDLCASTILIAGYALLRCHFQRILILNGSQAACCRCVFRTAPNKYLINSWKYFVNIEARKKSKKHLGFVSVSK